MTITQQKWFLKRAILASTCVMALIPFNAHAQDLASDSLELEEITVTAQKRSSSLQDEAIAITAVTAEDIERAGGVDPEILGILVPNLHVGEETNRDGLQLTIRGVSGTDVRNGADPTTAFHVDGSYVPRLSGANAYFYDLERIEVLRGPQGTLYGRNSTAGVVNVITKKPDFDDIGGSAEITAGNFDLTQFKGVVNLPLSETLATRFALIKTDRDGYRENAPTEDGDDADDLGLRGHISYQLSEATTVLLTGEYYERQGVGGVAAFHSFPGDTSGLETSDPADRNPIDTQGFRDNSDTNLRAEFTHDFGSVALTYQGAFRDHERNFLADADFTESAEIRSSVREITDSETWTHEVRLTSTHNSPFQYILGGYFLREEIDGDFQVNLTTGPGFPAGGGLPFFVRFVDQGLTNRSIAGFLHTTYDVSDRWQLVAGLRYTDDEKDKGGTLRDDSATAETAVGSYQTVGIDGGPTFSFAPQISNPSFNEVTWKAGVNFTPDDSNLLYASVSTGFKSGGFNRGSQGDTADGTLLVFEPETVTAYEIGWKANFNNRHRLNIAAFYYDYKDLQQAQMFTNAAGVITNQTINATSADVWGIEAEGETVLGSSGRLSFALGYLDTEFGTFEGVDDPLVVGVQSLDASGNRLTRAPEFTATVTWVPIVWEVPFGGSIEPRWQFHYESDVSLAILDRPFERQNDYSIIDLSLLYTAANDSWYAELFAQNLRDTDVATFQECFDFGQVGSSVQQCERSYATPRTLGVRFGYRF